MESFQKHQFTGPSEPSAPAARRHFAFWFEVDQAMAQWNTECHRNESQMSRGARQLTDVNVSEVNPSRVRA